MPILSYHILISFLIPLSPILLFFSLFTLSSSSRYRRLPSTDPRRREIENAIVNRRREEYEDKVARNRYDTDSWFDYIKLEETEGLDIEKTRGGLE